MITKFDEYLNENILGLLKGPSEEEFFQNYQHLVPNDLLIVSVSKDFFPGVKKALELGADVNYKLTGGTTALSSACSRENYQITKYLIDNGADIKNQGGVIMGILIVISIGGDIPLFKEILKRTNFIPSITDLYSFMNKALCNQQDIMKNFLLNTITELEQLHTDYIKKIANE